MLNDNCLLLYIQNRFSKIDKEGTIFLIISYSSLLSKTGISACINFIIYKKTAVVVEVPRLLNS